MNPTTKPSSSSTRARHLTRALSALCIGAASLCLGVACTPTDPPRPADGTPQATAPMNAAAVAPTPAERSPANHAATAPAPVEPSPATSPSAPPPARSDAQAASAASVGVRAAAITAPRLSAMSTHGASCAATDARAITQAATAMSSALTAQRPLNALTDLTADAIIAAHLASDAASSRAQAANARVPRAKSRLSEPPKGAPRNTRQVAEGYWLGSEPLSVDEVEVLHRAGVRVIISAVGISAEVKGAIDRLGITHLSLFFGRKFPDSHKVLRTIKGFRAHEVFVHCEYGGDRSGVMIAFLLSVREGWRPDHALLAMTVAQARDVDGLLDVLGDHGLVVTEDEVKRYLSIYAGRFGGLKVRNHGYKTLVASTLLAMSTHGVSLTETPARVDTADTKPPP